MRFIVMNRSSVIRGFDIVLALTGGILALPLLLLAAVVVRLTSRGPAIFRQVRLGRNEQPFFCLKLRTMAVDTPSVATHHVTASQVTYVGKVLRRFKLDELPQLWNVLVGEMSLVGPRPCLPSQTEVAKERRVRGVYSVRPGITGPAQVKGIDMSEPVSLAEADDLYALKPRVTAYFVYIILTVIGRGQGDRVREK